MDKVGLSASRLARHSASVDMRYPTIVSRQPLSFEARRLIGLLLLNHLLQKYSMNNPNEIFQEQLNADRVSQTDP